MAPIHFRNGSLVSAAAIAGCIAFAIPAAAEQPEIGQNATFEQILAVVRAQHQKLVEQERRLAEQERRLAEQERWLTAQQEDVDAQQDRIEKIDLQLLHAGLGDGIESAVYDSNAAYQNGYVNGMLKAQAAEPQPPEPVAPEGTGEGESAGEGESTGEGESAGEGAVPDERIKGEKPKDQLLLEAGGILLPKGVLQLEPGFEYTHFSNDRVAIAGFTIFEAIVIGTIRVDRLDRDILTGSLTARYGLLDDVQIDMRVPGVYRRDLEVLGVGTVNERERTIDGLNIGDVEFGVSWQPIYAHDWIPDLVLRVDATFPTGVDPFEIDLETITNDQGVTEFRLAEAPTGSGFYTVAPGFTAVWREDPVAFFAGASYKLNLPRDVGDNVGDIDPGDTLEWFGGVNVALSEKVGLNLSFVDQITDNTTQNGEEVPNTSFNDGRLVLGTSIGISPNVTLLVAAAAGLTEQSPDYQFTVRVPITFNLLE